ncbi:Xaa-Pro peptidase family protein [Terrarubrum flagellatum]|uniref:M24 family metallopeptidase n=1 Tax=Terrirubrum flagellatum TaxID=2895980 RepID=UPI003144E0C6
MAEIFKDLRKREYLNAEGADKPLKSPLPHETLMRARAYRKERLRQQVVAHDCAAILLYDPCNIRYALDVSNMQVWMLHNASHYALLFADGRGIAFEYRRSEHLAKGIETVDEIRTARTWFYMTAGDRAEERLNAWADEIVDALRERGGGNMRLAVDKLEPAGVDALRKRGVTLIEGQEVAEKARVIKSADELALMRWTIRVCEAGMARMYEASLPGKTENEIWAELHFENARSGGEWLETRLLACGRRTNPWFQESSDAVCEEGAMLAFDTDMIGPYGYCADLSRSWTIGHVRQSPRQRTDYAAAREQIEHNVSVLRAGMPFSEFHEKCWKIPEKYRACRYGLALHGVGMADEWPSVPNHIDAERAYAGRLEENMVVCVESLIGEENGPECIKLETQVLITANGAEPLDSFPYEEI